MKLTGADTMDAATLMQALEQQRLIFEAMTKKVEIELEAHTKASSDRDLALAQIVGEALEIALDDDAKMRVTAYLQHLALPKSGQSPSWQSLFAGHIGEVLRRSAGGKAPNKH